MGSDTIGHIFVQFYVLEHFLKHLFSFYLQLLYFLKQVSFNNTIGEKVSFDQNGVLLTTFDVINWVLFPNESLIGVKVGMINSQVTRDHKLMMNKNPIVWHSWFNKVGHNCTKFLLWIYFLLTMDLPNILLFYSVSYFFNLSNVLGSVTDFNIHINTNFT